MQNCLILSFKLRSSQKSVHVAKTWQGIYHVVDFLIPVDSWMSIYDVTILVTTAVLIITENVSLI